MDLDSYFTQVLTGLCGIHGIKNNFVCKDGYIQDSNYVYVRKDPEVWGGENIRAPPEWETVLISRIWRSPHYYRMTIEEFNKRKDNYKWLHKYHLDQLLSIESWYLKK